MKKRVDQLPVYGSCGECGSPLPKARTNRAHYCTNGCRQAAYRRRQARAADAESAQEQESAPASRTLGRNAENTPSEAPGSLPKPEIRNAPYLDMPGMRNDAASGRRAVSGAWLWVDPRMESGYSAESFDAVPFLRRAIALFQAKLHWGGRQPNAIRANPAQADNGLEQIAKTLGLRVVSDPMVTAGTYMLGLAESQKERCT